MSGTSSPVVVVGYDGSDGAREALWVAAGEAARRRCGLRVVHAVGVTPYAAAVPGGVIPHDDLPWRQAAQRVVDVAAAEVCATYPGVEVTTCVRMGAPAVLLLQEAKDAELLVVGATGHGLSALLLGSTSAQLATHAPCPVLIARRIGRPRGPVVLGIDGGPSCEEAVEFAFGEAFLRGVPLLALNLYLPWSYNGSFGAAVDDEDYDTSEEHALVSQALAGWREKFPEVQVATAVRLGRPSDGLVEASNEAQLVVVGSRGLGGFRGLLLGSVSRAVMHRATCSVAVVPGPTRD